MIKDRIVCRIRNNNLKEILLKIKNLYLATCIQVCKAEEDNKKIYKNGKTNKRHLCNKEI